LRGFWAEVRTMDKMRRILVFQVIDGDFSVYKKLSSKIDELASEFDVKIYSRKFNDKNKTSRIDISFPDEKSMFTLVTRVTEILSENGLKEELISRERILPEEIERDLKEFKEAVAEL
jgi:hypothetical protein